jgi:hypothetical protein
MTEACDVLELLLKQEVTNLKISIEKQTTWLSKSYTKLLLTNVRENLPAVPMN